MASLATGSVNFPTRVYDNAPDLVDWLAAEMKTYGIKPEVEAFDLSMIFQAVAHAEARARSTAPLHIQFVMGIKNAMPVDREVFEFYVRDAEAPRARRHLDGRRHRPGPAHAGALVARARRALPHRPRGQRSPRQGHAGAVERGAGAAGRRAVRRLRADGPPRPTKRAVCCACLPPRRTPRSPPEPPPSSSAHHVDKARSRRRVPDARHDPRRRQRATLPVGASPGVVESSLFDHRTMISGKTTLIAHLGYPTEAFGAPMIYNPWFEQRGAYLEFFGFRHRHRRRVARGGADCATERIRSPCAGRSPPCR